MAAGVMPFGTGASRDLLGTCESVFMRTGTLCFVATVDFFALRQPQATAA